MFSSDLKDLMEVVFGGESVLNVSEGNSCQL